MKAEATDMKMLPIGFNFDFAHEAKQVFEMLKDREPMPVSEEIYTDEHMFIDDMVASYFGFQDRLEEIRNTLIEQVNFRHSRAKPQGQTPQNKIDKLVSELYNLTEDEIAIVEGSE